LEKNHYAFVLVADEKYWSRLSQASQQGKQIHFFVRKSKVGPTEAKKLLFYVKKKMQIRGTADFAERVTGDVDELWNKHGAESFFESFDEYKTFAEGRKTMTFIRFQNFTEIATPQPKETVTSVLGSLVWFKPKYVSQQTADLLTT
jgi:hypothetical protein